MNIVTRISQDVALSQRNANWYGVCPKCKEKALSVSLQRQLFYCFGCHEGGSAVSWSDFYDKATNPTHDEPLEGL